MLFTRWVPPGRHALLRGLPTPCAVCRSWDVSRLCADCLARFAAPQARCRLCALEMPAGVDVCGECLRHPPPFQHAVAALRYAYPWDGIVSAFKFHQALDLSRVLADQLQAAVRRSAAPLPQWVLPVPLSERRLRERGYNQAWELARRVARGLGCRADARALLRIRDTPHQLALPREQREHNVRGAFIVDALAERRLRGAHLALVDDVMTTGATAREAAEALLRCGAASVQVWLLARTPRG